MPSLLNELIELAITNEDPALLAEDCLTLRGEGATIATTGNLSQIGKVGLHQMGEPHPTWFAKSDFRTLRAESRGSL